MSSNTEQRQPSAAYHQGDESINAQPFPSGDAQEGINSIQEHNTNTTRTTTPNVNVSVLLEDSLLVDQAETLQEIPVTPVKHRHHHQNHRIRIPPYDENEPAYCLEILHENEDSIKSKELEIGDHVYQWRSWMGIPGVFQHHGIVMDIVKVQTNNNNNNNNNDGGEETATTNLTIADFSNVPQSHKTKSRTATTNSATQDSNTTTTTTTTSRRGLTQEGILRTYTDTATWHKVQYEAEWWKRQIVYRAGTCTNAKSDAVGFVLARVHFIVQHPELLPDYHVVNANCECVAVWCKTGQWSTLQASSFLEYTAAGQVKSTSTLAMAAANAHATVPAAGLWGWLGYTSQVSWLSLHPMVIPALAGYAAVTVGVPAIMYSQARTQWKETSQRLVDAFWENALEHPDVFAECLTHWSDKR